MTPSQVFVFWKSDTSLDLPDLQLIFTPASYKEGKIAQLDDYPGMTSAAFAMRPQSRGSVRARSAGAHEPHCCAAPSECQPHQFLRDAVPTKGSGLRG